MSLARLIHLIAHRGNARQYPENTLPAFASALSIGLRFIELDVHLSADLVPIVIHDHELRRTTGLPGSVFELSAQQLSHIDAHEPERFGERFRGTRIPLLTEVLALLAGRPELTVFVEIKRASLAKFGREQVVERLLPVLRERRDQCVVISFDLAAVVRARELGGLAIGWVLERYATGARHECETVEPEFLFCDLDKLPRSGALWSGPWRWAIYEIESLPIALALAERGVHHIETMAVQMMSEALRAAQAAEAAAEAARAGDA